MTDPMRPLGISDAEISIAVHGYLGSVMHTSHGESLIRELRRLNNRTAMDLARDIYKSAPNEKIQNIKTLRQRCNLGLKEAKDIIEQAEVEALEARLFTLVSNNRELILSTFQTIDPNAFEPPF